jgi:hypothetical protein
MLPVDETIVDTAAAIVVVDMAAEVGVSVVATVDFCVEICVVAADADPHKNHLYVLATY